MQKVKHGNKNITTNVYKRVQIHISEQVDSVTRGRNKKLPKKWPQQFLLEKRLFSKQPKTSTYIWTNSVKKYVTKNFQKPPNVVTLDRSISRSPMLTSPQTASALHPQTLSTILPSTGQNKRYGNILLYETSMFIVKMADHDGNHRCLVEKNVPIAFILIDQWDKIWQNFEPTISIFIPLSNFSLM